MGLDLGTVLQDPIWQVRGIAALSVADVGGPEAVTLLIGALDDEAGNVRRAAAVALAGQGAMAVEAVPALERALGDEEEMVRDAARDAIERITQGAPSPSGNELPS